MRSCKGTLGLLLAGVLALGVSAAPAGAATDVYPAGGGQFNGEAEGWEVTTAECNVAVLCTAGGGYDGSDGRPAGSLAADTNIGLNLVSLFSSTVSLQSPDFKATTAGTAGVHLDRRFSQGSLVDLSPQLDYSVELIDRTSGKRSTLHEETLTSSTGWGGVDGPATLKAGHTYALAITAVTSSNVVGTGLLSGSTSARFDNVAVTVGTEVVGGKGGGAGGGAGGPGASLASRLAALAPATFVGPAKLKGKRLFVKARCPKKIGRACRVSVRGLLKKRKPATTTRTVKIAKGKTKRVVLRVKPRARGKVAARKRLLFKVRVRAGKAQAVAFKRLKLIRR